MNRIEEILRPYANVLGSEFKPYLNHAQRVYAAAEKLSKKQVFEHEKFAIACAFHDIGIWTGKTWDYVDPSIRLCSEYLKLNNRSDWEKEIGLMISQHHKLLPYHREFASSVELFRKADLVDFSNGIVRFGIAKRWYQALKSEYPQLGFHGVLFKCFKKHVVKYPFRPFPMVKF